MSKGIRNYSKTAFSHDVKFWAALVKNKVTLQFLLSSKRVLPLDMH